MKKAIVVLLICSLFVLACIGFVGCSKPEKCSAKYEVLDDDEANLDARVNQTANAIRALLVENDFKGVVVRIGESDGKRVISVEINYSKEAKHMLDLIGRPASLYFTLEQSDDPKSVAFINGKDHLERAYVTTDNDGNYAIGLDFNAAGANALCEATSNYNIGRTMYIYIDGELMMSPRINYTIVDSTAYITGSYTYNEASDYALILQFGALSVNLRKI